MTGVNDKKMSKLKSNKIKKTESVNPPVTGTTEVSSDSDESSKTGQNFMALVDAAARLHDSHSEAEDSNNNHGKKKKKDSSQKVAAKKRVTVIKKKTPKIAQVNEEKNNKKTKGLKTPLASQVAALPVDEERKPESSRIALIPNNDTSESSNKCRDIREEHEENSEANDDMDDDDHDFRDGDERQPRNKKSNFAEQLMEILDDEANKDVFTWMPDGKSFTIVNHRKFTLVSMPKLFNIRNMSSFVRKLTRWGFQRAHDDATRNSDIFRHTYFQRGRPELLSKVRCVGKVSGNGNATADVSRAPAVIPAVLPPPTGASAGQTREDILKECRRQGPPPSSVRSSAAPPLDSSTRRRAAAAALPVATAAALTLSPPPLSQQALQNVRSGSTLDDAPTMLPSSPSRTESTLQQQHAALMRLMSQAQAQNAAPVAPSSPLLDSNVSQALALYRRNLEQQLLLQQEEQQAEYSRLEMQRLVQQLTRSNNDDPFAALQAQLQQQQQLQNHASPLLSMQASSLNHLDAATQIALERLSREEVFRSHHLQQQAALSSLLLANEAGFGSGPIGGGNGFNRGLGNGLNMGVGNGMQSAIGICGGNVSASTNSQLHELLLQHNLNNQALPFSSTSSAAALPTPYGLNAAPGFSQLTAQTTTPGFPSSLVDGPLYYL